eukprot:848052-Prorocentrum_minimum.AAC.1
MPVTLAVVNREDFLRLLVDPVEQVKKDKLDFMCRLAPFQGIAPMDLVDLVEVMYIKKFGQGEELITEGHPAYSLYFILDGKVKLLKDVDSSNQIDEKNPITRVLIGELTVRTDTRLCIACTPAYDWVGDHGVLVPLNERLTHILTASAGTDVTTYSISKYDIARVMPKVPPLDPL